MAKFLQQVLNQPEPAFSMAIRQLETMTGHRAIDTRLVGEILTHAHRVMRAIGLDPRDTTAVELYEALKSHAEQKELFEHTHYTALIVAGDVVSFHQKDIALNRSRSFGSRSVKHVRVALARELARRYVAMSSPERVEHIKATLKSIDSIAPEPEMVKKPATKQQILVIGDLVIDEYIELSEKSAMVQGKGTAVQLTIPYGQAVEYDDAHKVIASGCAPNAAVAFARLGLKSSLMSWVGNDQNARSSVSQLTKNNVDVSLLSHSSRHSSNKNYIVKFGDQQTIFEHTKNYLYKFNPPKTPPDWIYLAAISKNTSSLHADLLAYLEKHPGIQFAFQPGTAHMVWGVKKLRGLYKRTTVLVLNRYEAEVVTRRKAADICELILALHHLGPRYVVVTDGEDGAYLSLGHTIYHIPAVLPERPLIDVVGAGDAFAATFVAWVTKGELLAEAGLAAACNSASVISYVGGQEGLLSEKELQKHTKKLTKIHTIRRCT